jgi:hypothetical protein
LRKGRNRKWWTSKKTRVYSGGWVEELTFDSYYKVKDFKGIRKVLLRSDKRIPPEFFSMVGRNSLLYENFAIKTPQRIILGMLFFRLDLSVFFKKM